MERVKGTQSEKRVCKVTKPGEENRQRQSNSNVFCSRSFSKIFKVWIIQGSKVLFLSA